MKQSSFPPVPLVNALIKRIKFPLFVCWFIFPCISSSMDLSSENEFFKKSDKKIKRLTRSDTKKHTVGYDESDMSSEGSCSSSEEEDGSYYEGDSLDNDDLWPGYENSLEEKNAPGSLGWFTFSNVDNSLSEKSLNEADELKEVLNSKKRRCREVNYCELSQSIDLGNSQAGLNFPDSLSEVEESPPKKKRKKKSEQTEIKTIQLNKDKKRKKFLKQEALEESDDDETAEYLSEESYKFTHTPQLIAYGTQLKLLANIYLKNMDQRANVFLPFCKLDFRTPNGSIRPQYPFFKTDKKENCIFVSGGLHNIWEKNVNYVNKKFFGNNLKIIRARWVQKYFSEEKIAKNFKDREQELHSEFYYDLFFRKRFIHQLKAIKESQEQQGNTLERISIKCFSWWAVCNSCEKLLSKHADLLIKNDILKAKDQLSYQIIARRRYAHAYPPHSAIQKTFYLGHKGDILEQEAWKKIWAKIVGYSTIDFLSGAEKEIFWTETKEGLEVCKWFGQAFKETIYDLEGKTARPGKKGDVLHYYNDKDSVKEAELEQLKKLLLYLEEKNWELSCWYRSPYPSGGKTSRGNAIEQKWKTHWNLVILPHYNWQVDDYVENEGESIENERRSTEDEGESAEDEEEQDDCQMCGYEKLKTYYVVSHKKFHISDRYEFCLQRERPELHTITRSNIFVLYSENNKLFGMVKDKEPLEISPSSSIPQDLIDEIIGIIQEKKKPLFENRPQDQKALLEFAFAQRYTLSNKFWKSKQEKEERACLIVGSNCVKTLRYTEEYIEEWRETHKHEDREEIAETRAILSNYEDIERAERELKQKERKKRKGEK